MNNPNALSALISFDFGKVSSIVLLLILIQAALIVIALIVYAILILRKKALYNQRQSFLVDDSQPSERERILTGIAIDESAAPLSFRVGDPFTSEGLIVNATFNREPTSERIFDFTIDAPLMDEPGSKQVTVGYGGYTAQYTIRIEEAERTPIGMELDLSAVRLEYAEGESFDETGLVVRLKYAEEPFTEERYDYTVEEPDMSGTGEKTVIVRCGKFIELYQINVVKREIVGIELDLSVVKTDFYVGDAFESEGLGVVARYNTAPYEERVTDFTVETPDLTAKGIVNVVVRYGEFTQTYPIFVVEERKLVGISLETSVVRREFAVGEPFDCTGLIVTADYDSEPLSEQIEDYEIEAPDMTQEGEAQVTVRYLDQTASYSILLVKTEQDDEEEFAAAEDLGNGYERVLVADKSFTAKLIQAKDEVKGYYSAIKNELLSYKKVHDRVSWKRETYKVFGEYVAKINFRGSTLCLYLPLDPADYIDSRYKVEDASSNKSSEDTPCLFRIKNEKRVRLAADLIAQVMEQRGVIQKEREPVDYTVPEQSTAELSEQGLIRYKYRLRKKGDSFQKSE